jgi:lipooligosaccharide transport system permease protein
VSLVATLFACFDWRSFAVLERNARVYLRSWRTAFLPPVMEPVVSFLAFGLGLNAYIEGVTWDGTPVDYATYVAPGILAYTAFNTPFFESLYAAYVRMFYQKTWDGILATQVELPHVVWGEVLWAGLRGLMNVSVVAVVLFVLHLVGLIDIHVAWLPLLPVVGWFGGIVFASFGLIFTAIVPSIDHMNFPTFLVGVPLSLISNTYFPLTTDSAALRFVMELNPIYHLAEGFRSALVGGRLDHHFVWFFALGIGYLLLFQLIAQRLTRRRVLGE